MNLPMQYNPLNWRYAFGSQLPLELDRPSQMAIRKELRSWEDDYIPQSGLVGKTVLDVGAGCGETAWMFINHGAKKVICVEPDDRKLKFLQSNSQKWSWPVQIIRDRFSLWHLGLGFQYAKIDCEGGEFMLLLLDKLPPMTLEIHSSELAKQFHSKFPQMRIEKRFHWPLNTWMGFID